MASEQPLVAVTCTAPVNIAVIKYCECGPRRGTRASGTSVPGGRLLDTVQDPLPRGRLCSQGHAPGAPELPPPFLAPCRLEACTCGLRSRCNFWRFTRAVAGARASLPEC